MSSSWIWILDSARITGWRSGLGCQFAVPKEISEHQEGESFFPFHRFQAHPSLLTALTSKSPNSRWTFQISHKTARGSAQFQPSLFPGLQWETSSGLVINPNCKFSMGNSNLTALLKSIGLPVSGANLALSKAAFWIPEVPLKRSWVLPGNQSFRYG